MFTTGTGGIFSQINQNPMTNNQPSNQQPNQSLQGTPFFGGNQNQTPTQGNLFGGNVFGSTTPNNNQNQGGGIFGGNNNATPNFGMGNNNTPQTGLFNGGSTFGGQNQPNQGAIPLGNNTTFTNPTNNTGGGIFGNNTGGGLFNNTNKQSNVFGNNNNNTPGIFGNNATAFSNNNTGMMNNNNSIFGQNNQNNANNNAFNKGTGAFGAVQNNTFNTGNNGIGLFGNTTNTAQTTQGGIFSNTNQNNNNTAFFGGTNNNNNNNSVFGNNTAKTNNGTIFGGTTNNNVFGNTAFGNTNTNTTGGQVFGGNNNQQGTNNTLFGGFGNKNTQGNTFGTNNMNTNQNNFNYNNNTLGNPTGNNTFGTNFNNNNLGNTTWGVPTTNQPIAKFIPLKPRNTKIDSKHVVKCITLLEQNMNFSKNQLRIRFMMSGGQFPNPNPMFGTNPQNQGGQVFGGATNNSPWFKNQNPMQNNSNNTFFGSNPTSNTGSIFGQSTNQTFFPQQNTNTNQGGIFGNNNNQTSGGLFGPNTNNNNTFKQTTGTFFGNNTTPSFGNNTTTSPFGTGNTQPSTNIFGTTNNNNNTTGNVFGNSSTPTTPTFGFGGTNTNPLGGGIFNTQSTTTTPAAPLFGGTSPIFGNNTPQQFGANQQNPALLLGQNLMNTGFMVPGTYGTPTQGFNYNNYTNMGNFNPAMPSTQPNTLGSYQIQPTNQEITTQFLNGLFNMDFVKKMMQSNPTNPFQQLVTEVKKKNTNNAFQTTKQFGSSLNTNNDNSGLSNSSRYNKAVYSSPINFNQSPYLYTDSYLPETSINNLTNEQFKMKFMSFSENFQPESVKYKQTQNILPKNITSIPTQKFNTLQNPHKKNTVTEQDLPIIDNNFTIAPTLDQLRHKPRSYLQKVQNVILSNQYGKIHFKQSINLYKKKISECIQIIQDSIEIIESDWDKKQCQLYFNNFGHYLELKTDEERNKMEKKIRKWVENQNMNIIDFDKNNGELHVQVYY